mmetsp:Transcript_92964/g.277468  ORF Transcript_92964/g.277468 Transcript_92964/m.277468 type:complete len:278 (-) Transcript_92964:1181-2014(-)
MHPSRNSSKSSAPLPSVSMRSKSSLASATSTSIALKNSLTSVHSRFSSTSMNVTSPDWSPSSLLNTLLACLTLFISCTSLARSMACCTNMAATTFITTRMAKEVYRTNTTPTQGDIASTSGVTSSFQSMPPVSPWNKDRTDLGTLPYHSLSCSTASRVSGGGSPTRAKLVMCVRKTATTYTIRRTAAKLHAKECDAWSRQLAKSRSSCAKRITLKIRSTRMARNARTARNVTVEEREPLMATAPLNNITNSSSSWTATNVTSNMFQPQPHLVKNFRR